MRYAMLTLVLAGCAPMTGCTVERHYHRPARSVTVLEAEHGRPDIVVVNSRPGPDRVCREHRAHWHCRAR